MLCKVISCEYMDNSTIINKLEKETKSYDMENIQNELYYYNLCFQFWEYLKDNPAFRLTIANFINILDRLTDKVEGPEKDMTRIKLRSYLFRIAKAVIDPKFAYDVQDYIVVHKLNFVDLDAYFSKANNK
ncbi:hypothetical protein ACFL5G_02320 [Candidatus Margulisiibacteriota bacterium]